MTRDEAGKLVFVMLSAVPSHRVSPQQVPGMVTAYADLLGDLSYEHCNAALRVLLQTRTWLPSVADLRSTALELVNGTVKPGGEAWGVVRRAIGAEGAYREPGVDFVFRDPTTARAVQALGWSALCSSENSTADRARFIELYDKLAAEGRREQQAPQLGAARENKQLAVEAQGVVLQLAGRIGSR